MTSLQFRRHAPLLLLLYSGLAAVWGWRLHSSEVPKSDETLQRTRVALAQRFSKLPQHRVNPALFQIGMLPDDEIRALAAWLDQAPILRLREVTVQRGPVHTPSPVNDALLLSEVVRADSPSLDEMRLLVAASGDRVEEPVKIEALENLASRAMQGNDPSLAVDILLRACDSPAAAWEHVRSLGDAARAARRPAAALRVVNLWLDASANRLTAAQQPQALDLQLLLLIEGGRVAEASRISLDALRAHGTKSPIPQPMLERALLATTAAGETTELLPWIEHHLRSHPTHVETWERLGQGGLAVDGAYRRWVHQAACIADHQSLSGTACDYFLRVAAIGDLSVLGRLQTLAKQVGRDKDSARLLRLLQSRPMDAHSAVELARALSSSGADAAAHDLLVEHLKTHPADRDAAYELAVTDHTIRGAGAAAVIWEGFLKRFPADVPALQQLTAVQLAAGQHPQALRTLQQIPDDKLDEAALRQIAALGEILDEVAIVHRARQVIVERQSKPAVADLMALAAVGRQHDDPAAADETLRLAASKAPPSPFLTELTKVNTREGNAEPFATAVEQVRSAIGVEE